MENEIPNDELVDVVVGVERVPGTQLVHLTVGDRAGLVLTAAAARALAAGLHRAASRPSNGARPRRARAHAAG